MGTPDGSAAEKRLPALLLPHRILAPFSGRRSASPWYLKSMECWPDVTPQCWLDTPWAPALGPEMLRCVPLGRRFHSRYFLTRTGVS
jgi:hypothetical protein